jgi:uncharacterized damage-inducible protein DinB
MGPKDVIRQLFKSNDFLVETYLRDFSDAELLNRPVPGANHIAWQLGHLINSEQGLLKAIPGCTGVALPAGWAEQYTKQTAAKDSGFLTKTEYLDHYQKSRANSVKNLEAFAEGDLEKATVGRMADFAPTLAHLWVLVANHPMMHIGQFVVMRRKLGKPVII